VILGLCPDGRSQRRAKLAAEKGDDSSHALQRESAAAKLADDSGAHQLIPAVDATMSLAGRLYQTALIPPLQLARADSGERNDLVAGELPFHLTSTWFKQKAEKMFRAF
jgi:hypothetical protein